MHEALFFCMHIDLSQNFAHAKKCDLGVLLVYWSPMITYEDFEKVDMRVGKIVAIEDFPEAHKPAFKLTIDFGPEIGTKRSSVQAVGPHTKEELLGVLVCCVVNFPPKQVGPFSSEVLTLGFKNVDAEGQPALGWVLVSPLKDSVEIGSRLR